MQRDLDGVLPEGIPEEWSYRRLQDVAAHITKGATPTTYGFAWESVGNKGSIPFMRSECVQDGEFVPRMMEAISPKAHTMMARSSVLGGDLLMTITGNIGRVCRYPASAPEANVNQHIARVRIVRPDLVDPGYAFWALHNPRQQSRLMKDLTGLAYPQISLVQVQEIPLPTPPLPEQRRIAEILDTLDEAIRKTEQVIAKLQQMKQGLLHDLLTRGIDENGELRDPERHPEQFKDSPLGRIPKGWALQSIEGLADNHDGRRIPLKQEDRDRRHGSFPYYGASGIIDWIDAFIFDGDYVLLGEDGENIVSRRLPLAFKVSSRFWVNNHAHIFTPKDGVDIQYLVELLEAQDYSRIVSGSAQPKITQEGLGRLLFAVAPHHEQLRIRTILASYQDQIRSESEDLEKLRTLKQGLMDDLLTGRVRVTVPEGAAA